MGDSAALLIDATGEQVRSNETLHAIVTTNRSTVVNSSGGEYGGSISNLTTISLPINHGDASLEGTGDGGRFNNGLNSGHVGGVNVGFGDGSVHFLADNVALLTLKQLATRDDGATVGEF